MSAPAFVPGHQPPQLPPGAPSRLVLAQGMEVVVAQEEGGPLQLPPPELLHPLADGAPHFLGMLGEEACFTAPLRPGAMLPPPLRLAPARALFGTVDEALFGVVGRAIAVSEWDALHRFCGRCASATQLAGSERARRCPTCSAVFYPRISPAVIVLIERGDRGEDEVLLARGANFPGKWFSLLAGFVEPGESLEETAAREVREEVGVEVADLRYFGSQPWPFGRSLMVGFTARYAGGELRPEPSEIAEAAWFRASAMPPLPPRLSIARRLIDDFLARKGSPSR